MIRNVSGALAVVLVILGVAAAFSLIGSPRHARMVALDERRANDLRTITTELIDRYVKKPLPATLPQDLQLRDPDTKRPYEYRRIDRDHYLLCATFSSRSESNDVDSGVWQRQEWKHGAGRTCHVFMHA